MSGAQGDADESVTKTPAMHPHPHPLPRLKTRNRVSGAGGAGVTSGHKTEVCLPSLECGPLSSSSSDTSDDTSDELDTAETNSREGEEEEEAEDYNQQSIMSDLDSLTQEPSAEPSTAAAASSASAAAAVVKDERSSAAAAVTAGVTNMSPIKLDQLPVSLSSEVPSHERSINTALEDELMLLRLLDMTGGRSDRSGATSLDSSINTSGYNNSVSGVSSTGVTSSRPSSSRIITADSIINTLQMEMATVGLTAAALNAATRHLDTSSNNVSGASVLRHVDTDSVSRAGSSVSNNTVIAPRPSLGR